MSDTSVNYERKGYGRGLILGLTMAETMLLLVFCLLLAAGAVIAKEKKEAEEALKAKETTIVLLTTAEKKAALAEAKAARAEADHKRLLSEIKTMMERSTGRRVPDEQWRELVSAKQAVAAIEESGLTVEEAIEHAPAAKVMKENAIDMETAKKLVPAVKELSGQGITAEQTLAMATSMVVLRDKGFADKTDPATELAAALDKAAEGNATPHRWPPIISMSELEGYNFKVGSAELSDNFRIKLREKASEIANTAEEYGVDIIEVIGHTDEQAMSGSVSNMDKGLKPVLDGKKPVGSLHPADNAGLGLARAISVAELLESLPEIKSQKLTVLPMSGGQLILPGDQLTDGVQSGDVKARRRIEIRVRKRSERQTTNAVLPQPRDG
ncbi:OmpA family protein [Mesorhizobium sp. LHD-90]|uniref:OmpA family protein n=1 Tax=Mesorhizobium sp. LHD-90 TaxID=3071414 RepID=UPI0027DF4A1A|nr:OmpA family protein [Mesorhizobium sp. LHD-90]MDQ6436358.1 OmpA family protein [Mesorhizobium sp. LHD-90]